MPDLNPFNTATVLPEAAPEAMIREPIRDSSNARTPLLAFVADDETEAALHGGLVNTVEGIDIRRVTILHAI